MSIFDTIDSLSHAFFDWAGHVSSLTDLQTVTDDKTFVLKNGDIMTLVEIKGAKSLIGVGEFVNLVEGMRDGMRTTMESKGRTLGIYYSFDPDDHRDVARCFDTMRDTAKHMHMNMDDVLDDWEQAVRRYTSGESVFVSIVTRAASLPPVSKREHKKKLKKNSLLPNGENQPTHYQNLQKTTSMLYTSHSSFVDAFMTTASGPQCNLLCEVVSVHRALWEMRHALYPEQTGKGWTPLLPGDKLNILYGANGKPQIFYPALQEQIFRGPIDHVDETTLKIGNRFYRGLLIDKPPLKPTNFNDLFIRLQKYGFPWRIAFHIDADGLGLLGWRDIFASAFAVTSSENRRFVSAKNSLTRLNEVNNEAIVRFRCVASVSGKTQNEIDANASSVLAELQQWGTMDAQVPYGLGQQLCVASTIPGLLSTNPGIAAAAPLVDVVNMMPFVRPAALWDSGLPLRTRDGHFSPFHEGSSKQTSFIEVGIGPMGSGKSLNANAVNLSFLLAPGQSELPFLSVIDVGPSSSGLAYLVRDSLPDELKHLATYIKLSLNEKFSINLCDTYLMARSPLSLHETFLINFLSLLATGIDNDKPEDGIPGVAKRCIEAAYRLKSDLGDGQSNPRPYHPNVIADSPEVKKLDQAIIDTNMHINNEKGKQTTWWEVVNHFFRLNMYHEATIAQRFAVPTLPELISASITDEGIRQAYDEKLLHTFFRRCNESLSFYNILSNFTRFSLGDARVVSLDLNDVAPKGSAMADRQTAIMYMMARQLVIGRFFLTEEDVAYIHPDGQEYYREQYANLRLSHKKIFFDELHRISQNSTVAGQIVSDIFFRGEFHQDNDWLWKAE